MESIGDRLKAARKTLGLTQTQIAEEIGGSMGAWQAYEADRKAPGSQIIAGLVRLGINANWVLTGEGPMLLSDALPAHPAAASMTHVIDQKAMAIALEAVEGVVKGLPTKTWGYAEKAGLVAAVYLVALEAGGDTKAIAEVFNGIAKTYGRGVA